ncbi:MAG TPA: prolyl oligopeptidase family serine peptidase [Actinomycetes bacterium]|nr:prolyl oligopeptidase family serine peptidase [Actinomycetes bacterium]
MAYDALQVTADALWWLESRPAEQGQTVLVRWTSDAGAMDAVPPAFEIGSRVHEYGGGAYLAAESAVFVVRRDDQRVYRIDLDRDGDPQPLTPPPGVAGELRYADLRLTLDRRWLVCVREAHEASAARNELVAIPTDGATPPRVLATGHDFYAAPRPSPDGHKLAWLSWDRPQMPWDGSDLWVADLHPDGRLDTPRHVAGGPEESIIQPEWAPSGDLYFLSDHSGWWNFHRSRPPFQDGNAEPLLAMSAEFADPPWELDYSTYAVLPDERIICRYRQEGTDHIAVIDPQIGQMEPLPVPYTSIKPYLRATNQQVVFIGGTPTALPAVVSLDLASGQPTVLTPTVDAVTVDARFLSVPKRIEIPTSNGSAAHALYHPPTNPVAVGPAGQRPPLLVQPHPGPTAEVTSRLDLRTQFFTSRGFAVVNVNYAGSSGYGRAYRERLTGQWGIRDVADCIDAAYHLTAAGEADPGRLLIAGASAGGYTALCALAFHDVFAAGTSYFGIADLETFRQQAPRFQAHQLDRLVGPYPQAADLYRTRSPIHAAGSLNRPLLLIQGLKDTVVPPAQAESIANALRRRGVPYSDLIFPEEGHGLSSSTSIRQGLEAELAFYQRALARAS